MLLENQTNMIIYLRLRKIPLCLYDPGFWSQRTIFNVTHIFKSSIFITKQSISTTMCILLQHLNLIPHNAVKETMNNIFLETYVKLLVVKVVKRLDFKFQN